MNAITIHPKDKDQESLIKKILKALEIPFEKSESPYNPEFVQKIKKAEESLEKGNYTSVKGQEELNAYLDTL